MKIPNFLESTYSSDHNLLPFTSYALKRISGHVESNRLEFFPEYTDHGVKHLELTLQTAIDMATESARLLMTPADASVLSVGTALHDFGMHLTRDGFETLISPDSQWHPVPEFDSKPWNEVWNDFYAEASRFDGRKLRSMFGENYRPPSITVAALRPPPC